MNNTKLKNYAPQARRDFIQAMTDRAAYYGLTAKKTEPVVERGDVAVMGGREFPRAVAKKRKALEDRIQRHGFEQTMEVMAYTWFNRLVALRFMELHGYFDHGYRVLSHPDGKATPEILEHAEHVNLPRLDSQKVIELKLDGAKEAELYRLLLVAQCNALHQAMPFLFERIDDETELLLPDNLLHSDSLIRKLVNSIDEADWEFVEIIGWLYQFYISEKKEQVIGKVVRSEDIPAATQLFTPNWIVKYLVQNTLGRQWLATYPDSPLRQQMEYYIEPAEQAEEVKAQLAAITPTSLDPEALTLLDPACGSGHILVEAYDLFKAIYQERGYRSRDIPRLILEKNLFGLEIDDRAAQLAAFVLLMKARADDRRIFDSDAKPNILAFQDSLGLNAADITYALNAPINKEDMPSEYLFEEMQEEKDGLFSKKAMAEKGHVSQADIASLVALFENAKTFGSLIQIPAKLAAKLPEIEKRLDDVLKHGDLTHASAHVLKPLLQQAWLLARQYDAVVANPPYMGQKAYNATLQRFIDAHYKVVKADLYGCFLLRNLNFCRDGGFVGMITIPNWMFISSFEKLRHLLFGLSSISSLVHIGRGAFGSDFGTCAFILGRPAISKLKATYRRLFDKFSSVSSIEELSARFFTAPEFVASTADLDLIPGTPIGYWVNNTIRKCFQNQRPISGFFAAKHGMSTSDNACFVRWWHELSYNSIGFGFLDRQSAEESGIKWFPYNKGGEFRRWYGNGGNVVNWQYDGSEIRRVSNEKYPYLKGQLDFVLGGQKYFFQRAVTWSSVSIGAPSMRWLPPGFIFDTTGQCLFGNDEESLLEVLAYLNSCLSTAFLEILSPTLHFNSGQIAALPFANNMNAQVVANARQCVEIARRNWNSRETAWDFESLPVLQHKSPTLEQSQGAVDAVCLGDIARMKELEEKNNRLFIEIYGLQDELPPEVPDDQITLYRPDRAEDTKRLLSYAIGCMMGRYSLDKPSLLYAHSGNQGFDLSQYQTFRADDDGIIPLLETDWGIRDDATNRIVEFIGVAWPKEHLDENLKFIADSLGPNRDEHPRDTIRRYLCQGFYKDHLQAYKRRPIYWLFSSGKQRAFQCLVYLHRYHEGTLARMRTEYVIPLQGKMAARITQLEGDSAAASSTAHRKKLEKKRDTLIKQRPELQAFDEKLHHYADRRIRLDLDDGVKVNYGKFGDLLAEVKAVCGSREED